MSSGGRFFVGYWFDCCESKALEFGYFFIGPRSFGFNANSGQFPVLARPFFNVNSGIEFSVTVEAANANDLQAELKQILADLGLQDAIALDLT